MTKKSDAPAIRFKGFSDAWEQRKLGDIADIVGGGTPSTGNQSYWDGDIDWYAPAEIADQIYANSSQKKITGLGYENSSAKMLPPGTVLFTSRAGIGKTAILTRKGCTNQGFQSIVPHRGELDSYFIFSRTEELKRYGELVGAGSTFVEVSGKQMAVMELMMPPTMREQQTIGGFFQQLDHLITLHQRKFEKLKNVKKSMLEKMFPQNGSSYPEIRFKGFTDPWEQRKFGEITSKYEDPVPTPHDGYYRLGIRSHAKGTFHSYVAKGQELETAQMHRVAAGNFIVNITFGWEHAVAITDKNDAGKLVSHRFPQFSFAEGMVPEFFRYVIVDEKFRHHLWLASPGGAGRNRVLKLDEMLNYLMRFPSRDEQIKIAEFFRHLDNLITLHQRKCANLCSPSQVVFSLLFATSTFSWEQRKLGELVDVCSGRDYKHLSEGTIPVYGTGGYMLSVNDALSYDRDAIGIGRKGTIDRPYILKAPFWTVDTLFYAIPREKVDLNYAFDIFQNIDWKKKDESTGVPSLSKTAINDIDVLAPKHDEQQIIGQFFAAIDNLITLHQRECISFTGRADRLILTANKKRTTSSWEQRKLSEITDKVTEKNAGLQYVETFTNSAEFGIISQRDFFDHDIAKLGSLDGYYIVKNEDFVYNPRISTSAPVGPINRNKLGRTGVMSPLYTVFRPHDIDTTYLEYFFKCGYWHSFMNFNGDSGARSDRFSIRDNVFFQMPIPIPDIDEQRKIGELLTCLDNLITLHQRKPFLMKWRTSDANRNQTNRLVL